MKDMPSTIFVKVFKIGRSAKVVYPGASIRGELMRLCQKHGAYHFDNEKTLFHMDRYENAIEYAEDIKDCLRRKTNNPVEVKIYK